MNTNFDILISGCNTRCKHCYVNGGPGGLMPTDTALRCIQTLDALAPLLEGEVSFTLDNEPMNHPDIVTILRAAASTEHIQNFHHGMTTGIALMARPDRDEVLQAYLENGYTEFGITVHGDEPLHDEIVRRKGAYRASAAFAEYVKAAGARLSVSLMLNRYFPDGADAIDALLERLAPDDIYFAVPNFTPHKNMFGFAPYRASLETLYALRPRLPGWKQNAEELLRNAERCTVSAVKEELAHGVRLTDLFRRPQDELYLTVHQNGGLFVGNTGAETAYIGNIQTPDIKKTAAYIRGLPGNRDYGAFYDPAALPAQEELIAALEGLPQTLLFADEPSVVCRGLAELNIPTIIMNRDFAAE